MGLLSYVSGLRTYGYQVDASLNESFSGVLAYFGAPRNLLKVCLINPTMKDIKEMYRKEDETRVDTRVRVFNTNPLPPIFNSLHPLPPNIKYSPYSLNYPNGEYVMLGGGDVSFSRLY